MTEETSKTYLVTGGTGFLGTALVGRLLDAGHTVRVLARSRNADLIERGAQWFEGSLHDGVLLDNATEGIDGVYHLAGWVEHTRRHGFDPFRRLHVDGTLEVLKAAGEQGAKMVYASTCGTVAISTEPEVFGEDADYKWALAKGWPYYLTKIEAEQEALRIAKKEGFDLVTMRPSLILGPGDERLSSSRTILDFIDKKIPFVPAGGFNYADVRDVAEAFSLAMDKGKTGATYLIGAHNTTIADFFQELAALTGIKPPRMKVPYRLAHTGARVGSKVLGLVGKSDPGLDPAVVEMAQHFWYLDAKAAREDLGWTTRDPKETLREAVAWVRANRERLRA